MRTSSITFLVGALFLACTGSLLAQGGITKYVRYSHEGRTSYGILDGDTIRQLDGDLFSSPQTSGHTVPLSDVAILAPCEPSKVIAVGLNYRSHLGARPAAEYPGLFAKYPTSIVGHEADIVIPPDSKNLHYEGELVIVIGKTAKNVSKENALDYVMGYTIGNDVSARDWQNGPEKDMQWWRAKGADTFGPLGPVISTDIDPFDFSIQVLVNGEKTANKAHSKDMIFDIPTVIAEISKYVTLDPGDIIFSGTPGQTSQLKPGDVVEVQIPGIGVLRNPVVSE